MRLPGMVAALVLFAAPASAQSPCHAAPACIVDLALQEAEKSAGNDPGQAFLQLQQIAYAVGEAGDRQRLEDTLRRIAGRARPDASG